MIICHSADFFLLKISFRNTISVSNGLDPDQARLFVGSDLDPNCLQRLSADGTSRQRVKYFYHMTSRLGVK